MTLLDALRHQWHRRTRSPTFGRSLIGGLFLLLGAAYFGVLFVAAGWFYPQVVAEVAPTREPLDLLNEHLLSGAAGLVAARFFLQRFDAGAWRALLFPLDGMLVWFIFGVVLGVGTGGLLTGKPVWGLKRWLSRSPLVQQ